LTSLSTRIAVRIDPLVPLIESNPRKYTYFGSLPNEYFYPISPRFDEHGITRDGPLGHSQFLLFRNSDDTWRRSLLGRTLQNLHGISLSSLPDGVERNQIHEEVLATNMPIWPADDSVAIVNDIIVINFGTSDITLDTLANEQNFRIRRWVSEGHANHDYEYYWRIYQNGVYFFSSTTITDELSVNDVVIGENFYYVSVYFRNTTIGYDFHRISAYFPNHKSGE